MIEEYIVYIKKCIIPAVAFGDYDSVTEEELAWMGQQTNDLHIVPREKDQTDLEIAINWALEQSRHSFVFWCYWRKT